MRYPTEKMSVELAERYYNNDLTLFWEYMADDILWIGPAKQQFVMGKKNLQEIFSRERHNLKFSIEGMSAVSVSGNRNYCEVLLRFVVFTYYPNGTVARHDQRITFFWRNQKIGDTMQWRYAVLHISNGMDLDVRDVVYPNHLDEYHYALPNAYGAAEKRVCLHGVDQTSRYLRTNAITFVEAQGKHCVVHTNEEKFTVQALLHELEAQLGEAFYRPHKSFLINVDHVKSISSAEIVLDEGNHVPVPQKKFRKIRDDITRLQQRDLK